MIHVLLLKYSALPFPVLVDGKLQPGRRTGCLFGQVRVSNVPACPSFQYNLRRLERRVPHPAHGDVLCCNPIGK